VKDGELCIRSRTVSLDDALPSDTRIVDGLEILSARGPSGGDPPLPPADPEGSFHCDVHGAELLSDAGVCSLPMPDSRKAAIRGAGLIPTLNTRSVNIVLGRGAVRSLESFREHQGQVVDGRHALFAAPAVRESEQIFRIPHRRRSIEVGKLEDVERRSYLHEAEALKHVPADRAELLAVFRGIPIELISRLRFLAGRKEILYIISGGPKRTRTNVHDMAAIRDRADQEVHLFAHRTKSRPVFLE
jgi:hypothetical protein